MRILIGYDGSESADAVFNDLRRAGLPREAKALIVSVGEGLLKTSTPMAEYAGAAVTSRRVYSAMAVAEEQAARLLVEAGLLAESARQRLRPHFPGWDLRTEVLDGSPGWELLGKAEQWRPDLVVVGSQGRSALGRFFLGSVSKKLATESSSSVRVARSAVEREQDAPPRIMIGVDGSIEAEHAVRAVGGRVWPEGTEMRIIAVDDGTSPARLSRILPTAATMIKLHNEESSSAARRMAEWAAEELRAIGLQVSVAIEKGDPQRVLIEEARKWDADSIFVGARSHGGALERFRLGSVSTALVTKAHCTVEVVRGEEEIEL